MTKGGKTKQTNKQQKKQERSEKTKKILPSRKGKLGTYGKDTRVQRAVSNMYREPGLDVMVR